MSDIDTFLQKADMETPRTPGELSEWVEYKTSTLSKTAEGKRYARSGAVLPKKLWEEIRPLSLFALRLYGSEGSVKCVPNLSNDNYDGRIDFNDASIPPLYVEITYAKDGYDESLRLQVLAEKGSVNGLGRISTTGTKASGRRTVEVENEAIEHVEMLKMALEIVRERILGKTGKVYGSRYVLVVVVDDYLPFWAEEDRARLEGFSKAVIENVRLDFQAMFLLGASGNYLSCVYGRI